jgi:hypothetical protein
MVNERWRSRAPLPRRRHAACRCRSAPLVRRTSSLPVAKTARNAWMRLRARTLFPRDRASRELRVAVVSCYRIENHDADTISVPTFRSTTTDVLCARGSAPEHSHADHETDAYHPTHRHRRPPLVLNFGRQTKGKRGRFKSTGAASRPQKREGLAATLEPAALVEYVAGGGSGSVTRARVADRGGASKDRERSSTTVAAASAPSPRSTDVKGRLVMLRTLADWVGSRRTAATTRPTEPTRCTSSARTFLQDERRREAHPGRMARQGVFLPPGGGRSYPMGRISSRFLADGAETEERYSISEWWLEPHTTGPGAHIPRRGRRPST